MTSALRDPVEPSPGTSTPPPSYPPRATTAQSVEPPAPGSR